MGNVCSCLPGSKSNEHISSSNHPFNQPGRTLNSTSQPHKAIGTEQARENMGQSQSTQGPGRTLGGSEEQPQRRETDPQMRSAAARAAEVCEHHIGLPEEANICSDRRARKTRSPRASSDRPWTNSKGGRALMLFKMPVTKRLALVGKTRDKLHGIGTDRQI